jgi:hypothetical protein
MPNEFFTLAFLASFAGAVLAVTVVTSALGYLFPTLGERLKYVAAALSIILMVFLAWTQKVAPAEYVLAVLNGFVVFLAAVGVNTTTTRPALPPIVAEADAVMEQKRLWRRW